MKRILPLIALCITTTYSIQAQDGMGIGNSNPEELLDVSGAIKIGGTLVGVADAGSIRWNGTNFQGYNGTIWVNLDGGSGVDTDWTVSGANMYSGVTGNVGIGTTSPDVKFELYTGAATTEMYITKDGSQTSSLLFRNGVTGAAGTSLGLNTAEHFMVQNNIGDKDIIFNIKDGATQKDMIFIDASAANVGINLSSPQDKLHVNGAGRFNGGAKVNDGSASVPSFRFYNDNNTGMYAPDADELGLVTGGSEAIRVDASGNVGIGVTTPSATLDVEGTFQLVDGTEGASKVLTSDASGNASWQTPVADGDGSASNELQTLSQSGTSVTLSNGGGTISVADNDSDSSNEIQDLSSSSSGTNRTINISSGTGTTISVADNDNSSSNELQTLSISGSTVTLSNGGGSVTVPADADWTVSGTNLTSAVSGNVGIGTTAPGTKLDVNGNGLFRGGDINLWSSTAVEGGQIALANGGNNGTSPTDLWFVDVYNDDFRIIDGGNVRLFGEETGHWGIGTTDPIAPLHVEAQASAGYGNFTFYAKDQYTNHPNNVTSCCGGTINNISIHASGRVMAQEFDAFSDARIKLVEGHSNSSQDLSTLMGIEITDYRMKDAANDHKAYKKVIAQQVESVYPQAVSTITNVVPDIYEVAEMREGFIALSTDLEVGDKVRLVFEEETVLAAVTEAAEKGFKVDLDRTENVFVYGREVDDFRTVDYEAISMLNVSATQELVKRFNALERENAEMQLNFSSLKAEIDELKGWTQFGETTNK